MPKDQKNQKKTTHNGALESQTTLSRSSPNFFFLKKKLFPLILSPTMVGTGWKSEQVDDICMPKLPPSSPLHLEEERREGGYVFRPKEAWRVLYIIFLKSSSSTRGRCIPYLPPPPTPLSFCLLCLLIRPS